RALENGFNSLADGYTRTLRWSVSHPAIVFGATGLLLVAAGLVFASLKREFLPADDRGVIMGNITAPEGSTLAYLDRYQGEFEQVMMSQPEVDNVFSILGRGGSPNGGFVVTRLKPYDQRDRTVEEILASVRPQLSQIAGVMAFASNPPAIGRRGQPIEFIVKHPDYDSLLAANQRLLGLARGMTGLVNVDTDLKVNKPELTVSFDRDRAEDLGVAVGDVATTLQTMLGGTRASTFTRENKLFDVLMQLDPTRRATPQDMDNLFVRGRDGSLVRLDAVATVAEATGPRAVAHYDRVRAFTLSAGVSTTFTLGEAIGSLQALTAAHLPPGTTVSLGGEARELAESGNELLLAFALAIIVVLMVLASQFESVVHPFTVLMAVPLAVVGAIFTLKLMGSTVNLYSQIGMILLVGLVTKNSILLVEYANQMRN